MYRQVHHIASGIFIIEIRAKEWSSILEGGVVGWLQKNIIIRLGQRAVQTSLREENENLGTGQ